MAVVSVDSIRRYLRHHFISYSFLGCLVVKVMIAFAMTNNGLSDHYLSYNRIRHYNDSYFVMADNEFTVDVSDNYAKSLDTKRLTRRSNDVSKSGDNQLPSYSSSAIQKSDDKSEPTDGTERLLSLAVNQSRLPYVIDCRRRPLLGQYLCPWPKMDADTQQPSGCNASNVALVNCTLAAGLVCEDTGFGWFWLPIECRHTNGYSYETALLLSIFLGMFGADRFYLGYPALGLLKFCTLGFLFLGQLVDILLIALQVVGPADGSHYVIKYFGPKLDIVSHNDLTDIIYDNNLFVT
ncbi:unnamed protein product [Medioppia subpectinata]|uniref:TM2 domain-containing protein n=1 Tax=Medioppia subpectinata TaxID=1979941 RepID=A0A7R9PWC3_9ACAR|nr:unnamed protein product [Medioppia subpectinata]CAG2103609.1 unnamed protein product [Medioppia subpectinata]